MKNLPINPRNILRHELIGQKTTIICSSDPNMLKKSGAIIDETQKTLTIRTEDGKTIITAKKDNTYRIALESGPGIDINGKQLYGRPEERIKKKIQNIRKLV